MAAYGPMQPQAGNGSIMNQPFMPPGLTNTLPAYAYEQMAQGMMPQRPIAQVNFPSNYQGPMPPNPAGAAPRPYMPPIPYANPAMDRAGPPVAMPAMNMGQAGPPSSQLLATLRESIYPAQHANGPSST